MVRDVCYTQAEQREAQKGMKAGFMLGFMRPTCDADEAASFESEVATMSKVAGRSHRPCCPVSWPEAGSLHGILQGHTQARSE